MRLTIYKQTNNIMLLPIICTILLGSFTMAGFLLLVKLTGTRSSYDYYNEVRKETERRLQNGK